jgi:hypothetical protein
VTAGHGGAASSGPETASTPLSPAGHPTRTSRQLSGPELRAFGYRESGESRARRRKIRGLVQADLRERETELRDLLGRLGEAGAAVYEVEADSPEAQERLAAVRKIDELIDETARAVRLGKAALRHLG